MNMNYRYNSTNTRPKNRGKNCLFQCFRPDNIVIDNSFETMSSPRTSTADPLVTYIAMTEKEGMVFPTILSTAWTATKGGGDQGNGWPSLRKKGFGDRSLRQAFMAALNETSLGKKIRKRRNKIKDNLFRSSSINNVESIGDKISNQERKRTLQTYSINSTSHYLPAFTPSPLPSSTISITSSGTQTSNSSLEQCSVLKSLPLNGIRECLTKQNQEARDNRRGYYGSNNVTTYMLLTSLLILVLYGKFCAILCTTIGFFVVYPRRKRPYKSEGSIWRG